MGCLATQNAHTACKCVGRARGGGIMRPDNTATQKSCARGLGRHCKAGMLPDAAQRVSANSWVAAECCRTCSAFDWWDTPPTAEVAPSLAYLPHTFLSLPSSPAIAHYKHASAAAPAATSATPASLGASVTSTSSAAKPHCKEHRYASTWVNSTPHPPFKS
eukprot:364994-Chlamydomonas_euryale.AAC.7